MIIFFKRLNILIIFIIIIFILGLIDFKKDIPKKSQVIPDVDAVVVLTGDRGKRIQEGYELINQTNYKQMFISGVSGSMNVLQKILNLDEEIVNCCIEVGYKATNTYENAIETDYWAKNNNEKSLQIFICKEHYFYLVK